MLIKDSLEKQGKWLFEKRGYVPFVFVPVVFLALTNGNSSIRWQIFCFAVSLFGLFLRWLTVGYAPSGTSGRYTKKQKATTLNTKGMYSISRNPLYFGNFLSMLGVVLYPGVWWAVLIYVLGFWIYCERIIASEESFLLDKFGREYEEYVSRIPIFIPNIFLWRRPEGHFSLKKVLRKEYPGFFMVVTAFAFMDLFTHYLSKGKIYVNPLWGFLFIFAFFACCAIYFLKKCTMVLR